MATAYVSFGKMATTDGNQQGPILSRNPASTEAITTSATSVTTVSEALDDGVAVIFSDAAHYVVVGPAPTAAATTGWYSPASQSLDVKVKAGDRVALITV